MTMAELNWQRHPSVTTGGKPFFWYAYLNAERVGTVVWNRGTKSYHVGYRGRHIGEIGTVQAGKLMVHNAFNNEVYLTSVPRKVKRTELRQKDIIALGWTGPWDQAMVTAILPDGSPVLVRPFGVVEGEGMAIKCTVGTERYTIDTAGPDVTLLQREEPLS
jgi:hypothetical protein